ncbi:pro-thyrotropin-releasing hormone isoform X2 [Phyllopteryx taeniolatus]|uniref:pro-thyrotropin-releasing hormone isoform X2 n=1 Tax=Phyllopteryx taeniolatus TaxID=161469 RepID=UPI002AD3CFAB|nr:pro-thyrotropin-releasing hormone isoform X2 [Phyllopteryx taeniolatus]
MLCAHIKLALLVSEHHFWRLGANIIHRSPLSTSRGVSWTMACGAHSVYAEDEPDPGTADDLLLQQAESLLLRSVLRKMQAEDRNGGGPSSQTEWMTKRQHPGKRYREDLDEEADGDGEVLPTVERRQHPGKRSTAGHLSGLPVIVVQGELSKRQHPGKRYLVLRSRRQHPGKRQPGEEEEEEEDEEEEEEEEEEEDQHPGKRYWDRSARPQLATTSPCEDISDPVTCAKSNLLLDFLDNIGVKHADEKRQHPGKRFAPPRDVLEESE